MSNTFEGHYGNTYAVPDHVDVTTSVLVTKRGGGQFSIPAIDFMLIADFIKARSVHDTLRNVLDDLAGVNEYWETIGGITK